MDFEFKYRLNLRWFTETTFSNENVFQEVLRLCQASSPIIERAGAGVVDKIEMNFCSVQVEFLCEDPKRLMRVISPILKLFDFVKDGFAEGIEPSAAYWPTKTKKFLEEIDIDLDEYLNNTVTE